MSLKPVACVDHNAPSDTAPTEDATRGSPERLIAPGILQGFAESIFRAAGSQNEEAAIVAEHLVGANLRGHDSHGLIRCAKYVGWVRAGELVPNRHATIVTDRASVLVVDGGFGYGQVIGREAMDMTIERAATSGLCLTSIRNAGHIGRVGAWAEQLAQAGFVSLHFVNTSGYGILVAPHGGSDRRLSANPIAAGAPRRGGPPIILDIATSMVAEGKIQVARNRGTSLEPGCVVDGAGRPTTDPAGFYAAPPGAIFPFGGHKGSGLSIFCEILAGSLAGGGSSHPDNPTAWRLVNNMLTVAIDPAIFPEADFGGDVERMIAWVKASPPIAAGGEVLMPGEIETRILRERQATGIPMDETSMAQLRHTAVLLGAPIPKELRS